MKNTTRTGIDTFWAEPYKDTSRTPEKRKDGQRNTRKQYMRFKVDCTSTNPFAFTVIDVINDVEWTIMEGVDGQLELCSETDTHNSKATKHEILAAIYRGWPEAKKRD